MGLGFRVYGASNKPQHDIGNSLGSCIRHIFVSHGHDDGRDGQGDA